MALVRPRADVKNRTAGKASRVSSVRKATNTSTMAAAALVPEDKPLTEQQKLFAKYHAEGESVPGPIPPTGNTNTPGAFKPDPVTFLKAWCAEGPTHHFALGVGHHAKTIKKLADVLGVEAAVVRPA